ncbi:MAG: response regulator receiver domain, partial [Bacteroidales bacterium]|nr:response regulator receiver domain [Bacteroidales bacterium]
VHNNEFDAKSVSDAFLKKGKICAIYAPQTEEDINDCAVSLLKADVVVLDWNLSLKTTSEYDPMADDESDNRGHYTKQLIKKLVDEASADKVKLIIVYTGETDLNEITDQIQKHINVTPSLIKEDCLLYTQTNNIRILVRAKETSQFEHIEQYKSKIVKYNELPNFIVDEFTKITMGLLPNYALSAITAIRDNTSNILGVFSKDIDPAFLGHYVSIPDCNDAISMLPKIFGTSVTNLIETSDVNYDSWIESWINEKIKDCNTIINGKNIDINAEKLKCLLKSSASFEEKFNTSFGIQEKKEKVNQYTADLYKIETTKLFCSENADISNYKWAKLVQHSNLFSSPKIHRLTTGTIIKYKEENKFLICIQQSCDSVRISADEKRTFLFLPLVQGIKGEAIVVGEHDHLIVDNKSYSIELHRFSPYVNNANITAELKENGEYVFEDTDGKQFVWVAELKEMFAQHIVSAYASQLSRVGIDNSEWIRLVGKTKK